MKQRITRFSGPLLFFLFVASNLTSAQCVQTTEWAQVIPSEGLPPDLDLRKANNNLDVVRYHDRYFLAFRNAPNHFASSKTRIIVLSSSDLQNWELETSTYLKADLREPRFIEHQGELLLYFFEGGTNLVKFEPRHIWYRVLDKQGEWSGEINAGLDGYVPWRIRSHRGKLYLSAYTGQGTYQKGHEEIVHLFVSEDGRQWKPISEQPQLRHPRSISEAAFIFDQEGNIWGVARMEFDGSMTFRADKDDLSSWKTKYSEFKYDSSLLFEDKGDIYLVARRNLDGDGRFVQKKDRYNYNLVRYSFKRKRTALFKLEKENLSWKHIADFPSTGDTAFPGIVKKENGKWELFNYSSNIHGRDKTWIKGQLGKTMIYRTELEIKECE